MSYKVSVNEVKEFEINFSSSHSGTINGSSFDLNLIEEKSGTFHVLKNHQSYNVEVLATDLIEKTFTVKVNGNVYTLVVKDKYDVLLKSLGFENLNSGKVNEVKAPMPGLVLDIRVNVGDVVKKGDALLVLEAMKMENILKSPAEGVVKKIAISKAQAVEKNQVLIQFE
jgi:biotin carboxyl carrier protein